MSLSDVHVEPEMICTNGDRNPNNADGNCSDIVASLKSERKSPPPLITPFQSPPTSKSSPKSESKAESKSESDLKSKSKTNDNETSDTDDSHGDGRHFPNDSLSKIAVCVDRDCANIEGSFNRYYNPLQSPSSSPSSGESSSESESIDSGVTDEHSDPNVDLGEASHDLPPGDIRPTRSASGVWKEIVDDFDSSRGGDQKILRAIGRTATVNAVVTVTAALGPIAAIAGYVTGGAITAKRLVGEGIAKDDPKEVAKSLAVFGSATSASLAGQAITGAVAIGVLGVSLPLAGALAFGVGCVSGISAGALSEWGVDGIMKKKGPGDKHKNNDSGEPGERDATEPKETPTGAAVDTDVHDSSSSPSSSLPTGHQPTKPNPKPNLVDACGAWVNRQRERNRQRRIEREIARQIQMEAPAPVVAVEPWEMPSNELYTEESTSSFSFKGKKLSGGDDDSLESIDPNRNCAKGHKICS